MSDAANRAKGTSKLLGADHYLTITAKHNLATALADAGQLDEAVRLQEETLRSLENKLGLEHPDTLTSRVTLAGIYDEAGRIDESVRLYEQTLPLLERILGPEHPHTLGSMTSLAGAYGEAGRWDEAVRLYEKALELGASVPPQHPDTLLAPVELAVARERAGQEIDQSKIPLLLESLVKLAEFGGPLQGDILDGLQWGSLVWMEDGKLDDAAHLMETVLRIRRDAQGSEHPDTLQAMIVLANIQVQRAESSAAEPLLLQAHEGFVRRLAAGGTPDDERQTRAAVTNLVQLYEKTNQPEKAAAWREKLDARKTVDERVAPAD